MTPNGNPQEEITIGKLSVRGIGCIPGPAPKDNPKLLCIILGKASALVNGVDKLTDREWTALKGDFLAVNLATNERFRSGKLFLPAGIHESIEERVRQLQDGGLVKFALQLRSVEAKNPAGYSYQAVTLMPIETENDSLSDMKALITGTQPQLAAPAETTKAGKK